MKTKCILFLLFFLLSISGFAQQNKAAAVSQTSNKTTASISPHDDEIVRLKEADKELKIQLDKLEKEVDVYRGDVRSNLGDFHDKITQWLTVLSIVYTLLGIVLGVAAPLVLNAQNSKRLEEKYGDYIKELEKRVNAASKQADDATNQAEQAKAALKDIEVIKTQVDGIEKKVGEASEKAIIAAKEAYASQLYSEALAEEDSAVALKLYDRVLSMDPNHSSAYYYRGSIKSKQGDNNGAFKDYTKSIELDPDHSKAYNNRGVIKRKRGDIIGAMNDFDKAIEIHPRGTFAYNNRGNLKKSMGDLEDALKDYDLAIEIYPEKSLYYRNRAKCYDELCQKETDEKKKAEYQRKAKADRKKANDLDVEAQKNTHGE